MMTASADLPDGRQLLIIGLSFGNLDKFRAEPGDTFIRIDGKRLGLATDVMIISGETEARLAQTMQSFINEKTKVTTDPRLKN